MKVLSPKVIWSYQTHFIKAKKQYV